MQVVTIGGSNPTVQNTAIDTNLTTISFAKEVTSVAIRARNDTELRVYDNADGGAYWTIRAGEVLEIDIAPGTDNPAIYIRTTSGSDTLEILGIEL